MKMIIGLGNPGQEYINTRHNVGFMALDFYLGSEITWKCKFNSLFYIEDIAGEKVLFLKPQTYINLSGQAVDSFFKYYKIPIKNLLVIHDDLDLEMGDIKLKQKSSSGGHNGIKSIIEYLDTNDFNRLKIGISNNKTISSADYVLGKFSKGDLGSLDSVFANTNQIIDFFIKFDMPKTMNKFNSKRKKAI